MTRKRKEKPLAPAPKTIERKQEILHHLGFEWRMFITMLNILRSCMVQPDDPVRVAVLESFMIHGRVLLDFLYGKRSYPTDWHVTDLVPESAPKLSHALKTWCKSVNKHVAHLAADRSEPLDIVRMDQVHNAILQELKSLQVKLGDDFPAPWNGDVEMKTGFTYPNRMFIEGAAATLTEGPGKSAK